MTAITVEKEPMGYPLGGEVTTTGRGPVEGGLRDGWVQEFQGGTVYRSKVSVGGPGGGAGQHVAVAWGAILDRYTTIGGPGSALGFPVTDELVAGDGVGRYQVFQNGMMTWHPAYGAWESFGLVHDVWEMRGGTNSKWGYPVGVPAIAPDVPVTVSQPFSGGKLILSEEFEAAGVRDVEGKPMSGLLLDVLEYHKVKFEESLPQVPGLSTRAAGFIPCKHVSYPKAEFGGVDIPETYISWACYKPWEAPSKHPKIGRHDYCAIGPDSFHYGFYYARLHGACARHDLCMDKVEGQGTSFRPCHKTLFEDIVEICKARIPLLTNGFRVCVQVSGVYYGAVTANTELF